MIGGMKCWLCPLRKGGSDLEVYVTLRACLHEGGGPQVGEVTCGGLPHRTCKRDHIKMRDCMDRRFTSPTWSTPPPCKQALNVRADGQDNFHCYCCRCLEAAVSGGLIIHLL